MENTEQISGESRHVKDIRDTSYWATVQTHFDKAMGPGLGAITGAADPHASPSDGSVAFTGESYPELAGLPTTKVCVVEAGNGKIVEISDGPGDRFPRWSPDGASLAFLSDVAHRGVHQLVLHSAGKTESTPAVDGAVEWLQWAPDGTKILLGVAELGADLSGAQGSSTLPNEGKTQLPEWFPEVLKSEVDGGWRRLWVYDLATDIVEPVSRRGLNVWEAAWLGTEIAAIVSQAPGEERWYTAELAKINPTTGDERIVFTSEIQIGNLSCSPSGEHIAIVEAVCSDRGLVAGDLVVMDSGGTRTAVPTDRVDITWTEWRDDRNLTWLGLRGMTTVAGNFSLDFGVTVIWESETETCGLIYPEGSNTSDGGLAIIRESYSLYPEIAAIEADGRIHTLVSLEHAGSEYIRDVGGNSSAYSWTAPDGQRIEGMLTVPEGSGPFPLLLLVHGGPVWSFRPKWSMLYDYTPYFVSMGWAVLHPNPRGSSGRGREYAQAVFGDMGGKDTQDYISGVESLIDGGVADAARIVVTGASYGGFMSAWLPTQTDIFAAAIPVAEVSDWMSQHWTSNIPHFDEIFLDSDPNDATDKHWNRSPMNFAAQVNTPMLHIGGALDRCTPAVQAVSFHKALLAAGRVSECIIYPQEGHGVRAFPAAIDHIARMTEFLDRHVPPA